MTEQELGHELVRLLRYMAYTKVKKLLPEGSALGILFWEAAKWRDKVYCERESR